MEAQPDLERYYNREDYDYEFVWNKLLFYHRMMLTACTVRERTRRLPKVVQKTLQAARDGLCIVVPCTYITPVDYVE
jgi:hypothetical protein